MNPAMPSGSSRRRRSQLPPGNSVEPGAMLKTRIPSGREIACHRLGEADLRGLGDVVARPASSLPPPDRRDERDHATAALAQGRQRSARDVQGRKEVLAEHGLEIFRVHVVEGFRARAADVVDDDVEAAQLLDRCGDDRRRPLRLGDVRDDADGTSLPRQRAHGRVELVGATRAEDDVRALLRRRVAIPRPMPRLEPVTRATLPASPRSIRRSTTCRACRRRCGAARRAARPRRRRRCPARARARGRACRRRRRERGPRRRARDPRRR